MFTQICVLVGGGNLYALIRSSMYAAVLESLMGENILPLSSKVCLVDAAVKWRKTCNILLLGSCLGIIYCNVVLSMHCRWQMINLNMIMRMIMMVLTTDLFILLRLCIVDEV